MGVYGPLARSVDDLALMFQVIAGPAPGRWEMPPVPLGTLPERRLDQLRLAWTEDFGGAPVSAETRTVLEKLAAELAHRGCTVARCAPAAFDFTSAWELAGEMVAVFLGFPPEFEVYATSEAPMVRGFAQGLHLTLPAYVERLRQRGALIVALEAFLAEWDALICPVTSTPAFPHQVPETPILVDDQAVEYNIATMSHTLPFNLTGHPVVVLPAGRSRDGLPIGVQLVGKRWGEMALLAVAKCIVQVAGPCQRPPGYA
jgi:amidase